MLCQCVNKLSKVLGITLLLILSWFWISDGINRISNGAILFDDSYNAQVSANVSDTGVYKVDYPSDIIFYNRITTGPTVLLPTALAYSLLGISNFSTALVPFLYSIVAILLIFLLAYFSFDAYEHRLLVASVVTCSCVLSSTWLIYLSSILLGEIAALSFTLLSVLFLAVSEWQEGRWKELALIASGYFLAFSFVSKTSQIFMCLVMLLLLLLRTVFRRQFKLRHLIVYFLGFFLGLFTWDIYRAAQFGDYAAVFGWWGNEWQNMFSQTRTSGLFDNFAIEKIRTRFLYLHQVINEPNWLIALFLLIPLVMLTVYLFSRSGKIRRIVPVIFLGVMSDSLLIYYVFFGADGLTYGRRLSVYGECLVFANVIIAAFLLVKSFADKNLLKLWGISNYVALICVCAYPVVAGNIASLRSTDSMSVQYIAAQDISAFIKKLPSDSTFYGYGWWQAPEVSLLSGKKFKDISAYYHNMKGIDFKNSYLIVGCIVEPPVWVWKGNFDSYLNQLFDTEVVYKDRNYERQKLFMVYKLLGVSTNKNKVY